MSEPEPRQVEMSADEFSRLLLKGVTKLTCLDCGYQSTEGNSLEQAATMISHQMSEHNLSREEAEDASINVSIWEERPAKATWEQLGFQARPGSEERLRLQNDDSTWIRAENHRCPRCGGPVPAEGREGQYCGARSRVDNRTEICSSCGTMEYFEEMAGRLTPKEEWPVRVTLKSPPRAGWTNGWENERSSNRAARTPIPTPKEVPDLRLHLLERWIPGGIYDKALIDLPGHDISAHWETEALRHASLWWIKDDMVRLTMAAAKSIPDDIYAEEVKLPANMTHGMAVLGAPYIGTDAESADISINVDCIVWSINELTEGVSCISISMYRYFDFAGGLGPQDLQASVQSGAIWDAQGEMVGNQPDKVAYHLRGGAWTYLGRTNWPMHDSLIGFNSVPSEEYGGSPMTDQRKASQIEDRRFFSAFCVLLNHKLSMTEMVWADRQVRRRSERHGVSQKEPSHVRLIRLRETRKKTDESDEEHQKRHVEWSHRWMVRGHMAWRRCGPKGLQRKLVFVTPHTKGPLDKPLVIKEDVRVWTR